VEFSRMGGRGRSNGAAPAPNRHPHDGGAPPLTGFRYDGQPRGLASEAEILARFPELAAQT